ncbi:MAG: hypothetical protein HY275_03975 [Gemmatimonadetes bacterium]|nr:hypothetical protein [Gemmatimonadota bacterium]
MRLTALFVLGLTVGSTLPAQPALERRVTRGTLVSQADPAGTFVIDSSFHYAGGQVIDILKVAGAEQHFFIQADAKRAIRRFYWIQFEHYYPSNTATYDYSGIPQQPVQIGRLQFGGDVRVREHYFTMDQRPGSDSKAAETFLRAKGYVVDGTFATLRLFHLPDDTRRRELMIIYGEVRPDTSAPAGLAAEITARAQAGLRIP